VRGDGRVAGENAHSRGRPPRVFEAVRCRHAVRARFASEGDSRGRAAFEGLTDRVRDRDRRLRGRCRGRGRGTAARAGRFDGRTEIGRGGAPGTPSANGIVGMDGRCGLSRNATRDSQDTRSARMPAVAIWIISWQSTDLACSCAPRVAGRGHPPHPISRVIIRPACVSETAKTPSLIPSVRSVRYLRPAFSLSSFDEPSPLMKILPTIAF